MRVIDVDSNARMDFKSDGLQKNPNNEIYRKRRVDFPKLGSVESNQNNHPRESSIDSQESEESYDSNMHTCLH